MKPYTILALFYDKIMEGIPYEDWVEYLEELFSIHKVKGDKILDLACGTGSLASILAERGYQVIGLDLSLEMLELAQKKRHLKENPTYLKGDMRRFTLDSKVDMVISTHDSINYIHSEKDLSSVFSSVYRALHPQGFFLFDMNSIAGLKRMNSHTSLYEGEGFYCFWRDSYLDDPPLWRIQLSFFMEQEDGTYYKEEEIHEERAYPLETLIRILEEVGFIIKAVYQGYTFREVKEGDDPYRYFFVCERGGLQ